MAVKWTDDEVTLLREVASSYTVTELAAMFGRTATAIYQAKYKYELQPKKAAKGPRSAATATAAGAAALPDQIVTASPTASGRSWTKDDDEALRREAGERTLPELAALFNRSVKAVRHRCDGLEIKPVDGRTTVEFREQVRQQRLSEAPREPEIDVPGATKPCVGDLHNGEQVPVVEFPWNRSGLSRTSKCTACISDNAAERQATHRTRHRPEGWVSTRAPVDCGPGGHICTVCSQRKAETEFYPDPSSPCGHASQCKQCKSEARRDRWAENRGGSRERDAARRAEWSPERRAEWLYGQWVYGLKRMYNLTVEQWELLNTAQGGVCALCGEPETNVNHRSGQVLRLAVDHDHGCCPAQTQTCGRCVRGLLCYTCNLLMGKVEAKPILAARFSDYLSRRPLSETVM